MILRPGTKVLVAHRRLYATDHGRYFTGVVDAYEAGMARITGHTWMHDGYRGSYQQKDDERTKIVPILSGSVIVYQLPSDTLLDDLTVTVEGVKMFLRDGAGFEMDLTEGVLQDGQARPVCRVS
ncbi:MAG: hypothetical protein AAGB93_10705, partial [Planctomycetota bacterium]